MIRKFREVSSEKGSSHLVGLEQMPSIERLIDERVRAAIEKFSENVWQAGLALDEANHGASYFVRDALQKASKET